MVVGLCQCMNPPTSKSTPPTHPQERIMTHSDTYLLKPINKSVHGCSRTMPSFPTYKLIQNTQKAVLFFISKKRSFQLSLRFAEILVQIFSIYCCYSKLVQNSFPFMLPHSYYIVSLKLHEEFQYLQCCLCLCYDM